MAMLPALVFALALHASHYAPLPAAAGFDVRQHLSTVTSYDASRAAANAGPTPPLPDGCVAIHLNLLARHGARSPTQSHIEEMNELASRLDELVNEAKQARGDYAFKRIPGWMKGWKSPWKLTDKGGELVALGEEDHYNLGVRLRQRFPEIFDVEYQPDVYPITATQVPRASASAVAFGMGLFGGQGKLGAGRQRAFSVVSESSANDDDLRFFENCRSYKDYKKREKPVVKKLTAPIVAQVTAALVSRYQLNFTSQDVESLWFLCKQEATLFDTTHQSCQLFSKSEIELMEYADDLELFLLKGYGKSVNYRMGVSLLKDIKDSMEAAVAAAEEGHKSSIPEKARLQFAHAETLVPFVCLLELFLDGSQYDEIQRGEAVSNPAKPPEERSWRGSLVSPFAGNTILALYKCPSKNAAGGGNSTYNVQVLHNEAPVPIRGCGDKYLCPFDIFKEKIVEPNIVQGFDQVCKLENAASDWALLQGSYAVN